MLRVLLLLLLSIVNCSYYPKIGNPEDSVVLPIDLSHSVVSLDGHEVAFLSPTQIFELIALKFIIDGLKGQTQYFSSIKIVKDDRIIQAYDSDERFDLGTLQLFIVAHAEQIYAIRHFVSVFVEKLLQFYLDVRTLQLFEDWQFLFVRCFSKLMTENVVRMAISMRLVEVDDVPLCETYIDEFFADVLRDITEIQKNKESRSG